ncbi:flagellar basal body rod protein FlgC [Atrimonas thermophila]|jgi:flagellar basal-body rod protein FlgC|uniref:flagellar basal body rod protein FlgC n=1 Tax=Atrimonas thermophila TaxID=3064161 RepID=UPI00399C6366
MQIFNTFRINASALTAERFRMDVIASNLANAEVTRSGNGGPYLRREVIFEPGEDGGVRVSKIIEDRSTPTRKVFQPDHPDADENGLVEYPNVVVVNEIVDLMAALRAYEANVTAINVSKEMAKSALNIGG